MHLRNLKISTQLFLGFSAMFIFVIVLTVVSYRQSDRIQEQTEILYNNSFQVRRAISVFKFDITQMHMSTHNLVLYKDEDKRKQELKTIDSASVDALTQLEIIKRNNLANSKEVSAVYDAFNHWESIRKNNTNLFLKDIAENKQSHFLPDEKIHKSGNELLEKLGVLDNFATLKADSMYLHSKELNDSLNLQLILLALFLLIAMMVIAWFIVGNIRTPIKHLIRAVGKFQQGDLTARSKIKVKNEFGVLSKAYNEMVETIKVNVELAQKTTELVNSMTAIDNSHAFFRELLPKIAELTNSQMAAVYLLSDDKKQFTHYESIGLTSEHIKSAFEADKLEGEFGAALSTRKIQHVKNIPIDTSFVYQTVSGKFVPREIVTIPVLANQEVVALISLASVRKYSDEANQLIDNVYHILSSRVEGILNYRKIRKFSKMMEFQNIELEAQKSELDAQSVELKQQNQELEEQKNFLDEANKLKTIFLSNMSHELRTPLNSVIALSGVLNRRLKTLIPEIEYSYLEVIERNGKHLLSLINDILDISRIEAGREEIDITNFSAESLIEDLIEMIRPQADFKNVDLFQINNRRNVFIDSDYNKCRHILQNLIANAVKFTDVGKVEIETIQLDDSFEIKISDTGIGIPENQLSHIFDEFRQADSSTSRRFGGTGLGLAIAKKYANLLGGTISVSSTPEIGSVFTLNLPLKYHEEKRIVEKPKIKHLPKEINVVSQEEILPKTILLVDDSEPALIQMKDFLENSGYSVLTASGGEEALELISQVIPDAMILDLMMPNVDGFSVLETLRNEERTANIPVLILSAKQISKDELKFLKRNNVHQLIQKGDVNREDLVTAVKQLVDPETKTAPMLKKKKPLIKGNPTILIVEDNVDNMLTVKAILGSEYKIFEAFDGKQGIKMAEKHTPDLILMDIALPGIDGKEAFSAIRKNARLTHIPIIALTASAMDSERETILAHGFDAYIPKPIDELDFFQTINRVLYGK